MAQAHSGNVFGRLATGAALGLFAGLALPHARKAVMQAPSLTAGDWADALAAEHKIVEKSFEALLKTGDHETAKREMLLTKIAYALTKHAIEEENVIYPALAEAGYADEARKLTQDHGQVKTYIYELRRISSADPSWLSQAQRFFTALQSHMREEETQIFPMFSESLSREENAKLTRMMNWEGYKVA